MRTARRMGRSSSALRAAVSGIPTRDIEATSTHSRHVVRIVTGWELVTAASMMSSAIRRKVTRPSANALPSRSRSRAKAITAYLGHASIQTTFDLYGHLMPGNEDEAVALVDAYLERSSTDRRLVQID
jgi:integrase